MSWPHVQKVLLTKRPRWTTPQQQTLLSKWAQYYRGDWGYALWSKAELRHITGMSEGTLNRVTRQLEALGVGGRIPDSVGTGGKNRYYIVVEAFEDRRRRDIGSPIVSVEGDRVERRGEGAAPPEPVEKSRAPLFDALENDQPPDHQRSAPPDHQRSAPLITSDQAGDIGTDLVPESSRSSTGTAAQARLDALLVEIQHKANQRFATDPASDGNYRAVSRAVRDVLADPGYAARLRLEGYDATRDSDVCELVCRLCERRHVLTGKSPLVKRDVIYRALTSERIKATLAQGAARPREAAAASRRHRQRDLRRRES